MSELSELRGTKMVTNDEVDRVVRAMAKSGIAVGLSAKAGGVDRDDVLTIDHIQELVSPTKTRDPNACPDCGNSLTVTETGKTCLHCDPRARVFEECRKLSLRLGLAGCTLMVLPRNATWSEAKLSTRTVLNGLADLLDLVDGAVAQLRKQNDS